MAPALSLDVYADIVCPWCFIGHAHLDAALAQLPELAVDVRYRPFELAPDMPIGGDDFRASLQRKLGGNLDAIFARVSGVGRRAGVELRFDRITRAANTRRGHRLVWLAGTRGQAKPMLLALFRAHFTDGKDVGDDAVLAALGVDVLGAGAAADVRAAIAGELGRAEVERELRDAAELGVSGVPLFVANESLAVSGAQPPEVLVDFLRQAARRDG